MKHRINSSVGNGCSNSPKDVRLVQGLLNVYLRREGNQAIAITGKCDAGTLSTIAMFQKNEQKLLKPDGRIDANGRTFNSLMGVLEGVLKGNQPLIKPAEGVVTFDSEGTEGGRYHSRILHVPSENSGLTLGRGYDMKEKATAKIIAEMMEAGVDAKIALLLGKASGKQGTAAKQFIIDNDLLDFKITPLVQKGLFEISYIEESDKVHHLCTRKDVVDKYGECDWDKMNQKIKEILIDLKFRGDYTSDSRGYVQEAAADDDLKVFRSVMSDRTKWVKVPQARFESRKKYLVN